MKLINKKSIEIVKEFIKSKFHSFDDYVEIEGKFYSINIRTLSKNQIKRLRDKDYI